MTHYYYYDSYIALGRLIRDIAGEAILGESYFATPGPPMYGQVAASATMGVMPPSQNEAIKSG